MSSSIVATSERVLAALHPDVVWANGMEGGQSTDAMGCSPDLPPAVAHAAAYGDTDSLSEFSCSINLKP